MASSVPLPHVGTTTSYRDATEQDIPELCKVQMAAEWDTDFVKAHLLDDEKHDDEGVKAVWEDRRIGDDLGFLFHKGGGNKVIVAIRDGAIVGAVRLEMLEEVDLKDKELFDNIPPPRPEPMRPDVSEYALFRSWAFDTYFQNEYRNLETVVTKSKIGHYPLIWVTGLCVIPAMRGQGIGRTLFARAKKYARHREVGLLFTGERKVKSFFEHCGVSPDGEFALQSGPFKDQAKAEGFPMLVFWSQPESPRHRDVIRRVARRVLLGSSE